MRDSHALELLHLGCAVFEPLHMCLREGRGLRVMLCFGSAGSPLLPLGCSVVTEGTSSEVASEQAECKDRGRKAPNQINAKKKYALHPAPLPIFPQDQTPRAAQPRAPMCQPWIPILPPANPCHGKAISVLLHAEALQPLMSHPHTS